MLYLYIYIAGTVIGMFCVGLFVTDWDGGGYPGAPSEGMMLTAVVLFWPVILLCLILFSPVIAGCYVRNLRSK